MERLRKACKSLLAAALLMTGIPLTAAGQPLRAQAAGEDGTFRVATYNIAAKGGAVSSIGSLIKEENIDVVGFQEVDKNTGRNQVDMLKEIADAAGYDYSFRKAIDYSGGEYGIGIASASEISNESGGALETGGYEGRTWQRVEIEIDGELVAVYNTHLTWEDPNIRAAQMEAVLDAMEADDTKYQLLTGDFNAQESNDEFDVFLRDYNIANGLDGEWLDTYIPEDATMKTNAIDNIIASRNIEIQNVEAVDEEEIGSDHKILIADCKLLEEEQVSRQLLDRYISKAQDLVQMSDRYTEESLQKLEEALQEAYLADCSTQEKANAAADALMAAIDALETIPADPSQPVAWWDFDGDEPLKDKTGRGNDGVEKGTISYVDGLENLGNALSTAEGYVSVAKVGDDLNLGTEDMSVGFWYKASNPGTWSAVLGDKNWSSGANPGFAVVQGQGQFYTTYAANGHGQQENIVSGTASKVYDGKWHYITAVLDRDGESMMYVDGQMIASTSIASTANMDATVSTPFNIGADGAGGYRINSLIDDVKVYRSVLSQPEIEAEYLKNRDKTEEAIEDMVTQTEQYLENLVIDPNETTQLESFTSEDGKVISHIFCSENDVIIDDEGRILRQPLVDKKVQISYIVQENKDGVAYDDGTMVENKWIVVKGAETSGSNPQPEVVPTMQEWRGDDGGAFSLNEDTRIIVSAEDMDVLGDAAEITRSDLEEMFGISAEIISDTPKAGDIVLALTESSIETEDEEIIELINQTYRMDVGEYVTVEGPAYKGVFFGTRSVLQALLTSGNDTIAYGTAVDYPNYPIRQFMLDVGRKYFPMWYLEDLVKYASWLKLTDFQCHLSEDTFNDYSAFRLESDIPHLTSTDGYYTKDEYREFQKHAENYGIRVITEIDGPAHARRFIELGSYEDAPDKYKNLGLDGTHFNLSEEGGARERVLNLMDEVLEEYLGGEDPVVITDAFNVGMDEYFGDQNDLRAYGVHMYDQVVNKYGKTAFGWDSNASLPNDVYTKEDYPIDDVRICYWKWEEVDGGVKALMDAGYKVVNGDHRWYIVPGAQIGFWDYANEERLYNELSAGSMVGWYGGGMIFPEGHPNIVGGTMLLWNDRGMFAGYTVNDIFARQRSQYPYLAQTYWYGREDESFEEFTAKVDAIEVGPGLDNLYEDIDSQSDLVYDFDMESLDNGTLKDNSGNGYDAKVTGAVLSEGPEGNQLTFDGDDYIEAQHKGLNWPYTAVFDLTIDEEQSGDITLFEEIMPEQECVKKDGNLTGQEKRVIVMQEQEDGTYRLTYSREGFDYAHDYVFEKGKPYRIVFSSDESTPTGGEFEKWNQPNRMYVNGELVSTLQGPQKPADFNGQWWVDSASINMPLEKIGQGLVGSLDNFKLYDRLLSDEEIKALGGFDTSEPQPGSDNLALHKAATASSIKNSSFDANYATDGSQDTRWGSNYNSSVNDPFDKQEWIQIDLAETYALGEVRLYWQDAYAEEYTIQLSDDGETFTDVKAITGSDGGEDIITLNGEQGRYLRILCTKAVPSDDGWQWNYGYSLFEVEAYEAKSADVDKTALNEAIIAAQALNEEDYTANSWNAVSTALDNAMNVASDDTADQNAVDAAADALNNAVAALQIRASQAAMDALQTAADNAAALKDDYSEEDFADVQAAITAAQALLDDPANASSTAVVSAMLDLSQAVSELPEEGASDKLRENLKATIDYINEHILTNVDNVRPGKVQELKTAVAEAYQVYLDADATDEEIQTAIRTLTEKAQELWEIVSKAELNALIETAEAIEADGYTEMSYRALQAAITAAKTVAANDDATTSEVTTAITDLASAIAGLEQITLDTSALVHEIELVTQMVENIADYVPSTVEGLADLLADAKEVLANATTQAEIDEAVKTLREARLSARTKADTSALEALIAEVNAMDLSGYTSQSKLALDREVQKAKQLVMNEEATQEEVEAALAKVKDAIDGLQPINAGSITTPNDDAAGNANADTSDTAAAVQTGALLAILLAGAAGVLFAARRRRDVK